MNNRELLGLLHGLLHVIVLRVICSVTLLLDTAEFAIQMVRENRRQLLVEVDSNEK